MKEAEEKKHEPYDYYCPICKEDSKWEHIDDKLSKCLTCNTKATNECQNC